ncbi:MAG TPA: ABC transporter permease [Bdellovibrionota bacterium]|jgi:phospholipid/cholesterol/gamma-HCH transport system permease protein
MKLFHYLGDAVIQTIRTLGGIGLLTKQTFKELFTKPFYLNLTAEQIMVIGLQSLLLVAITGITSGAVMTLQFGYGLEKFGGKLYIPKVMGISLVREMGPVFTSLMVAGRMGSGMAAEIGSMRVTQQIDAIRALGTSPIKRIVIPRLLAMLICLPLLTLFADLCGMLAGMLVGMEIGLGANFFWEKVFDGLVFNDYWTGTAKTIFFGFFIAMIACYRGLNTEGGTKGVGNSTTWVVVASSIAVMVGDFFLTKFFIHISR